MTPDQIKELRRLADHAEGAATMLRETLDEAVSQSGDDPDFADLVAQPGDEAPIQRVTVESIEALIRNERYFNPVGTLTICVLTLANGTHVVGHSACLDPRAFNAEIGKKIARESAVEQVWALEGYAMRERMGSVPVEDFAVAAAPGLD